MIHIGTWFWGKKYPQYYLERLKSSIARNLRDPYQFHIWEPEGQDLSLTKIPGCFARLRAFDPEWQQARGIKPHEDRVVVIDLDLVVTGSLDRLFDRDEPFTILQGVNATNPCPYNGSIWSLRAGTHSEVVSEFSLEKAGLAPWFAFPDDQAWFHHMIPNAGAFGVKDGIYAFKKPGWPSGSNLPKGARMVAFPGFRDPSQFTTLNWVKEHWR